jgi:glycine hydroxymethyltransferase
MHIIAAKAVSFKEALSEDFKEYQKQIVKNAKRLADEFTKRDFRVVSGGTDNHLMLLDLRSKNVTGKKAEALLDEINITVNKNTIPEDPESPFVTSGIRVGTPAVTTLGLKEDDMAEIADIVNDAIMENQDKETLKNRVKAVTDKYNKTI